VLHTRKGVMLLEIAFDASGPGWEGFSFGMVVVGEPYPPIPFVHRLIAS
jgi:hypothetical protein